MAVILIHKLEVPDFIHLIVLLLLHLLQQRVAKITKHGNKAISSVSRADFLEEAGANINHDRSMLDTIFSEIGLFLFAPLHHQAMKYVIL